MHNFFIYSSTTDNVEQRTELKRTGVHIMPRAIPCTSSCDPRYGRGSLGAFARLGVRARKLGGFVGLNCAWNFSTHKSNRDFIFIN